MSIALSHSGTSSLASARAVAERARSNWEQVKAMAAADRMGAQATKTVQPANKLVQTPFQIRDQVMAERGVDRLDLMRMGAQARLEAEISIDAETRERARQAQIRTSGNFLDLKA
jgi:hypothetical protein